MKESPLHRDLWEHRREVVARLTRIEDKQDKLDDKLDSHKHPGNVTWVALVPLLVALIVGVFSIL